ncbi:MAG: hypothetical protein V1723_03690 [Candidatus Uhrbacteria bacterium]
MRLTASRLQHIPHAPGVYAFTHRGVFLYVGKAADLRERLAAYRPGKDWKTEMLREATGLRIIRTNSELEAVLLEANWIKIHQPKHNIANKDGKRFLYIEITNEEFPQVRTTRTFGKSGTYFGPFTSAYAVRETLRALRKIFPFRCKNKPIASERRGGIYSRPLPQTGSRSVGRADVKSAPTIRMTSPCLYFHLGQCAGTCAGLITAVQYRRRVIAPLVRLLRGETISARRLLDVEHRVLLDQVLAHTRILSVTEKYANDLRELQRVLHLPQLPHRIEGYDVSDAHGRDAVAAMVVAIDGGPEPSEYKRFKIRTLEGKSNDVGMLAEVLTRRLGHAPMSLRGSRVTEAISTMDARTDGIAAPRIDSARNDKKIWPSPDLLLIDGGKPQLNAAIRVMRRLGVSFSVVALAKRAEEIYLPGERFPLRLPRNSSALHLLQRIRDEAHRFAVSYHHFRRTERMFR